MTLDPENPPAEGSTDQEQDAELRKLRRLQIMVAMVLSLLRQDRDLTLESAHEMMANCRNAALAMFPGKELAFDMIYQPRLERALKERFGTP
ncbi:MAG TPA: hypothetical protein VKE93_01780 [Candidatus Angelobacter sp.]|nr:hypothetical protein [Candidatus Angelobacter sp.]